MDNQLKTLYEQQKFDEIINVKSKTEKDLSAKSLYYIGMAYYKKDDDNNALKHLDLAINKGPADHDMYFYKGIVLYYLRKYNDALPYIDKAIAMLPGIADFYGGKADVFYALNNFDSARIYLEKATKLPECKPRLYVLLSDIYMDQGKPLESISILKTSLSKIPQGDEQYQSASFNLGLLQQLNGDSIGSRETFEKHVALFPADYHAKAKLIQAYYRLGEFEKAKPVKAALYEAQKNKLLPDEMKEMFCFDQFIWNGKRIMVFEHYGEPGDEALFVKHNFYVLDDKGKVDYQVRSESSFAVRMTPNNKYVLCLVRQGSFSTYWDYVFNDEYKYPELKKAVLNILNKNVKPSASTIIGK